MSDWDEAEQRVEKAHELYEQNRWEEAACELQAAIAINPYNSGWHFNLGLTLDALDRPADAVAEYRHALAIDPDDVEVLNALGYDCIRLGHHDEAITHLSHIEKIDPAYEPSYCNRIIAYCELGQHDLAEQMFYLARQYKDKCPHCYYNMGNSLFARARYDRALWCFNQVLELMPAYPQVHARVAEAHWAKGQLAEARGHFLQELRANPGQIDTLLDLGQLLVEMHEPLAAGEKFRQVLELQPDEPVAHFQLGQLAMTDAAGSDLPLALESFRRVLQLDPKFRGAHLRIAQVLRQQGDPAAALFHANAELAHSPTDEYILVELGNLFMDSEQLPAAESAFRRALEANAGHAAARHNLAVTLLLSGRLEEGIAECKRALRSQPKYMLAMHNLALAYLTKHDWPRAQYWLREALDIAPEDPQLRQLQTRMRLARMVAKVRGVVGWGGRGKS